jgi:phosphohistidine phosphatase
MLRHLYLIRHAEAAEKALHQTDLQRELTYKGKQDAINLGRYLSGRKTKFDEVFCSSAVRTLTTAQLVVESLSLKKVIVNPALYHASHHDMLHILRGFKNELYNVAIVGHNPTISAFANSLSEDGTNGFSPCTLAVFEFYQQQWSEINSKTGKLLLFIQPPIS